MPTEILDILSSANVDEKGGAVKRARRSVLITGLDATYNGDTAPAARIAQAYNTLSISQGERHPTYTFLYCKERNASIVDLDKVQFDIIYEPLNFAGQDVEPPSGEDYVLSGGASLEREETYVDVNGDPIELSFTSGLSVYPTVAVSVPVLRPRREITLERSILIDDPGATANTYVGQTNNATWNGGVAGTWLCTAINFTLRNPIAVDGAGTTPLYRMRFDFRFNPNGHNPSVVYTDPETGQPIAGWETDVNASAVVSVYEQVSFAGLPT